MAFFDTFRQRLQSAASKEKKAGANDEDLAEDGKPCPSKWSLGVLNDRETEQVPGECLWTSAASDSMAKVEFQDLFFFSRIQLDKLLLVFTIYLPETQHHLSRLHS